MRKIALLIGLVSLVFLGLTATAQATIWTDNFDDGVADGWTVRKGTWLVDAGQYKSNAGENYWTASTFDAAGSSFTTGYGKTDFKRDYIGTETLEGIHFGYVPNSTMWFAGVYEYAPENAHVIFIRPYTWTGTDWSPSASGTNLPIPALTAGSWYNLLLEVSDTEAKLTLGGNSVTRTLAGVPAGNIGLGSSVGWTSFDNWEAGNQPIPEPTSLLLLGSGLIGLLAFRKKSKS